MALGSNLLLLLLPLLTSSLLLLFYCSSSSPLRSFLAWSLVPVPVLLLQGHNVLHDAAAAAWGGRDSSETSRTPRDCAAVAGRGRASPLD